MRKASPKVRMYLAKQALERYYRDDGMSEEKKGWMHKLYGDNLDSKSIKKLQMRLLSRECCEIIVGALIKVLERNIEFLEQHEECDSESLKRLKMLRDRYMTLQGGMEEFLKSEEEFSRVKVLRERLRHVELSMGELADLVGYSHTTVDLCLAEFLRKYYYPSAGINSLYC